MSVCPLRIGSLLGLLLCASAVADAATIAVTSASDDQANDGVCTLREAIVAANTNTASGAAAGECAAGDNFNDTIAFNIPGAGVHTIHPGSPTLPSLPTVTASVVIDGYTQPGARTNAGSSSGTDAVLLIEISGVNTQPGANGLMIAGTGVTATIRGLIINGFSGRGIQVQSGSATITGNFIGTNPAGTAAGPGNGQNGIEIAGLGLIGGAALADRNLISGNGGDGIRATFPGLQIRGNLIGTNAAGTAALGNLSDGIELVYATAHTNLSIVGAGGGQGNVIAGNRFNGILANFNAPVTIRGNRIGVGTNGTTAMPNGLDGIRVESGTVQIGGTFSSDLNVVSANTGNGLQIAGGTNHTVQGNVIGTDGGGAAALGNGAAGIVVSTPAGNVVNVGTASQGNVIVNNGGAGVLVSSPATTVAIRRNSIRANGGLGIDLGGSGVVPNDAGDGDSGANNLQNFPALTSAAVAGAETTIVGNLNTEPNAAVRIEYFSNAACDASLFGEGDTLLAAEDVVTDANGNALINTLLLTAVPAGLAVTATATLAGATSGFSQCVIVTGSTTPSTTVLTSSRNGSSYGEDVTFTATVTGDQPTGAVAFMDLATTLGTAPLTLDPQGNYVAAFTTSPAAPLAVGDHWIKASYPGDALNAASSDTLVQAVGRAPTTTTLSADPVSSVVGQPVTFTANVTGIGPTGTVTFSDTTWNAFLGSGTPDANGVVSIAPALNLTGGDHSVLAQYSGDGNNQPSVSTLLYHVDPGPSELTLVSSINPSALGQLVSFTATVDGASPTGTVTFLDGATPLGTVATAAVNATSSSAGITTSALGVGSHLITARYNGDANNEPAEGGLSQTVVPVTGVVQTTTALSASENPTRYGLRVALAASVSGASPGGTVTFTDTTTSTVLGSGTLDVNGVVMVTTQTTLTVGDHTIVAEYSGDARNTGSSATITETVEKAATGGLLDTSGSTRVGDEHIFTARLDNGAKNFSLFDASSALPTGTITLTTADPAAIVGPPQSLIPLGGLYAVAEMRVRFGTVGLQQVTVFYSGDENYKPYSSSFPHFVTTSGGRCFIATAAYGSYLDPHVQVLRDFRDRALLTNRFGRAFVGFYYEHSPPIAAVIERRDILRVAARVALTPIVYGVEHPRGALLLVVASFYLPWLRRRTRRLQPQATRLC